MSKSKKTWWRRLLSGVVILATCWWLAYSVCWQWGWGYYEAGGGSTIYEPLDENEMESAVTSFRRASLINPWGVSSRNYAGKSLIELGRYEESLVEFDSALSIWSRSFTAHYRKSYALMKLKRYPEMVESLKKAIELQGSLGQVVRFSTEFEEVQGESFMEPFLDQY
ncbi:Tetratricopeptide repeat protein [Rubripirellula tenax]|uniref:Tetratricopeptide repeat protein n=1 Tax=Rubripirellula tenax TaxID=2528015 RepID=A0A5C6ECL2_9BACT|nr:tetratricopeptide repeat protein [Rubripirellula tenax]TWU46184.1 Tetratricopeptide repeat protein [Rubripirellula tenax]